MALIKTNLLPQKHLTVSLYITFNASILTNSISNSVFPFHPFMLCFVPTFESSIYRTWPCNCAFICRIRSGRDGADKGIASLTYLNFFLIADHWFIQDYKLLLRQAVLPDQISKYHKRSFEMFIVHKKSRMEIEIASRRNASDNVGIYGNFRIKRRHLRKELFLMETLYF